MASIVAGLGYVAAEYVVPVAANYFITKSSEWGSHAVHTWLPAYCANQTVSGWQGYMSDMMGGQGTWLGDTIGYGTGSLLGYIQAPFVAQSDAVQGATELGAQAASAVCGTLAKGAVKLICPQALKEQEVKKGEAPKAAKETRAAEASPQSEATAETESAAPSTKPRRSSSQRTELKLLKEKRKLAREERRLVREERKREEAELKKMQMAAFIQQGNQEKSAPLFSIGQFIETGISQAKTVQQAMNVSASAAA